MMWESEDIKKLLNGFFTDFPKSLLKMIQTTCDFGFYGLDSMSIISRHREILLGEREDIDSKIQVSLRYVLNQNTITKAENYDYFFKIIAKEVDLVFDEITEELLVYFMPDYKYPNFLLLYSCEELSKEKFSYSKLMKLSQKAIPLVISNPETINDFEIYTGTLASMCGIIPKENPHKPYQFLDLIDGKSLVYLLHPSWNAITKTLKNLSCRIYKYER